MALRLTAKQAAKIFGDRYKEAVNEEKTRKAFATARSGKDNARRIAKSKYAVDGIPFKTKAESDMYLKVKGMFEKGEISWFCYNARCAVPEPTPAAVERYVDYIVGYPDGKIEEMHVQGRKPRYARASQVKDPDKAERPNKYRAKSIVIDGIFFHSRKEGKIYNWYRFQQRIGEIDRFYRQCHFLLDAADGERVEYISDYLVVYKDGRIEHVDVKPSASFSPEPYRTKRIRMRTKYGILLKEIYESPQ